MTSSKLLRDPAHAELSDTADRYIDRGFAALLGADESARDEGAAARYFELAISMGALHAYRCLADLYSFGRGVIQSSDTALQLLRTGALRGDAECHRTLWAMHSGRTIDDRYDPAQAELAFQDYLEARDGDLDVYACAEYFDQACVNAHRNAGGQHTQKLALAALPGKHINPVLKIWTRGIAADLATLPSALVSPDPDAIAHAFGVRHGFLVFERFWSGRIVSGDDIVVLACGGLAHAELAYLFAHDARSLQKITRYASRASAHSPGQTWH
jgi:hypothetical protein